MFLKSNAMTILVSDRRARQHTNQQNGVFRNRQKNHLKLSAAAAANGGKNT